MIQYDGKNTYELTSHYLPKMFPNNVASQSFFRALAHRCTVYLSDSVDSGHFQKQGSSEDGFLMYCKHLLHENILRATSDYVKCCLE